MAARDALLELRRAAEAGRLRLDGSEPASPEAIQAREAQVTPHFGAISWSLPPGYRAFLAEHNRLHCLREDDDREAEFTLVDDKEIVELNADLVHMPEGVGIEPGIDLSTNHLVGFAEAGYEAVWCFDITQPDADGEYPVYYHHQDEPRARRLADGTWDEPADATPDFPTFTAWLTTLAAAFTAPEPPAWLTELGTPTLVHLAREGAFHKAP